MTTKYEKNFYLANLAEQCGRYKEMAEYLEEIVNQRDKGLNKDERNQLSIAYRNSINSIRSAISGSKNLEYNDNDNEINIKRSNNHQLINKVSRIKNNIPFDNNNINNNFDTNHFNKEFYNDKKLPLYHNKRIIEKDNISLLRNNLANNKSNTINNISNFNNCNYIYLFNNGQKYVKINNK